MVVNNEIKALTSGLEHRKPSRAETPFKGNDTAPWRFFDTTFSATRSLFASRFLVEETTAHYPFTSVR